MLLFSPRLYVNCVCLRVCVGAPRHILFYLYITSSRLLPPTFVLALLSSGVVRDRHLVAAGGSATQTQFWKLLVID